MPKARSPNQDKAKQMYIEANGSIDLTEIARQLNLPDGTIRGWKSKGKWDSDLNGTFQTNTERSKPKITQLNSKKKVVEHEVDQVLDNTGLTDNQRLFCLYYVKYRNKTKAYQKAYNASWDNANANAYKVWCNMGVRTEINRLLTEYRSEVDLDIKDLFQWYLDIARADINDYVTITNTGLKMRDGSDIDGILVSEVKEGQFGISVKLLDKMKAMQWLGEHIGLAEEEQRARIDKLKNDVDKNNKSVSEDDGVTIINDV